MVSAAGPEEAIETLEKQPVDVVLTDQRMPGRSGTELLEEIRERFPHASRAIITGFGDDEQVCRAVERGLAEEVFEKPWRVDELKSFIRSRNGAE